MNRNKVLHDLTRLESLLQKHEVPYALVIRELRSRLLVAQRPEALVAVRADLQRLFSGGGMGSLSDVWISKRNGNVVDNETAANSELTKLRHALKSDVYED